MVEQTTKWQAGSPTIGSRDRLTFSFFVVCLVHAVVVFGIRFINEDIPITEEPPAIDISINLASNDEIPESTYHLGRTNSTGGDLYAEEDIRRSDLFASVELQQDLGVSPVSVPPLHLREQPIHALEVLHNWAGQYTVVSQRTPQLQPQDNQESLIDQEALIVASLTQELRQIREKNTSQQNNELTLNSNTREYIAAGYIKQWIEKVESIGNTNLPPSARNLTGEVILEVRIDKSGKNLGNRVLRSSGHPSLDNAALKSVILALPFEHFSQDLAKKIDTLNIVRTWRYNDNRLSTVYP